MAKLFDKDSDSDGELKLNTETQYAKKYDTWRQKEIMETLKARYGDQGDDSTSSEEDEMGIELTPQVEKDFFRTLACLKKDDEILYNADHKFFAPRDEEALARAKAEKPMFLREFERRRILEHGGIDIDEEDPSAAPRSESPTLAQEQRDLVASFRTALDSDSDSESLLVPRERKAADAAAEEASYATWLRGNAARLGDNKEEAALKPLRDYWTDPKLDEGEAFLKDYVLGRRYLAGNEITEDALELSDDEKAVESQENFERRFNFRFEEPDAALIRTYPRTMENSVRLKDTRRKEKREATKIRHEQRREQQVQELMQLKALKRKEIQDRIEALKKVTGNDTLAFQDSDIEGEFDPSRHDQRMQSLFSEPYYAEAEEEKPEFSDLDDEPDLERWDEFAGQSTTDQSGAGPGPASQLPAIEEEEEEEEEEGEEEGPHCEDAEFNMDADYDPTTAPPKKEKQRRKRKVPALWTALHTPHPTFDPKQGTFDAFVDEYYKLDFEDIIGDLPCRFKYRQVPPNDFGLTIDEILRADDKELNAWASVKKATRIRPLWLETKEQDMYARRGQNEAYKRKMLTSLYQPVEEWEGPDIPGRPVWTGPKGADGASKKRKKAGGKRKRGLAERGGEAGGKEIDRQLGNGEAKRKKKKHRHDENSVGEDVEMKLAGDESECPLENGEVKRKKKKHSKGDKLETEVEMKLAEDESECATGNGERRKNKNKKHRQEENSLEEETETKLAGDENWAIQAGEVKKKKKKHRQEEYELVTESAENLAENEMECAIHNGEGKKKKKKKHRHVDSDSVTESSVKLAANESEGALQNGEVKYKKKKKHRHEDNDSVTESSVKLAANESEGVLQNEEVKKKKKKHRHEDNDSVTESGMKLWENDSEYALQNGEVKKKKEKKTHQNKEIPAKAAVGGEAGISRRKRRNLKVKAGVLQKKPKKINPKDRNFKREQRRLAKGEVVNKAGTKADVKNAETVATEKRLAAYGLPRPKRFLNYLKHKDGGTGPKH